MTGPMEARNRSMLFKGLVVDIEQMEVRIGAKGWHVYQVVRHPGGVGVLPLHDDGTVTLIRQLRPAIGGKLLEIPAGRLHPGEDPADCGRRELAEETGLAAESILPLGPFYPSPGVFDEVIHLFLGKGLTQGAPEPEHYEEIETVRLPLGEALRMAGNDDGIRDGKTIVALLRAGCVAR
ncbi:MAG: mismatch repair protein MutT [Deltaproteobacteria bacterium]|nr:mismatch repair protein MutT [Deltaproteobacteria bacterium]